MDEQAQTLLNQEATILVPQIEPVVPEYGGFRLMNTGAIAGRNQTTIVPQAGQDYQPGVKARLFFPRQHWTDGQEMFLHYDITFQISAPQAERTWRWKRVTFTGAVLTGTAGSINLTEKYVDAASVRLIACTSSEAADEVPGRITQLLKIDGVVKGGFGVASTQSITDALKYSQAIAPAGTLASLTVEFKYFEPAHFHTLIQNGQSSVFSTVRVLESGNEAERIDLYGLLQRWQSQYTFEPQWTYDNGILQGYYKDKISGSGFNITSSSGRSVKVKYCVPLWNSAYFKQRYIPNTMMQEWQLELTLDTYANSAYHNAKNFVSGEAATTWQMTGLELVTDLLEPKPWYQMAVFQKRTEGNLFLMMNSVTQHSRNINGSKATIILTDKFESIQKVMWGLRLSSDLDTLTADSGIARSIIDPANNVALRDYQYRLGTMTYPNQPIQHIGGLNLAVTDGLQDANKFIDLDFHSYEMSLASVQKFRVDNPGYIGQPKTCLITPERFYGFTINDFGMPQPYDSDSVLQEPEACIIYTSFEKDKGFVSGANTQASNIDLQIEMRFTNSVQSTVTGEFFLFFNQAIRVLESGSTEIFK